MWRKTADAKNPSPSSNVPEAAGATPKVGQNSPSPAIPGGPSPIAQASTQASTPAPASAPNSGASYSSPASASNPFAAAPRASSVSVIGAGLKIQGEITGDSDLVVEGEAHGRIRMLHGRVTVGANGLVNADIEAVEISVEGSVQGGLKASDRVRLGASSRVQGSVMTPRIAIEDGARLRGKVEMIRAGEAAGPTAKAPLASAPVSSTLVAATAGVDGNANATKSVDPAPAIATEADRLKSTAARGSGD
jgi:cytoskeletal protein CcmA (bactofilin family)